jgi:hypothetical protein
MNSGTFRRRLRALGAAPLIVALFAASISTRICSAEDSPKLESWHIEGRVVDASGQSVAGARVFTNALKYLSPASQTTTRTDSDGRFRLEVTHRANGRMIRASDQDGARQAATHLPYEFENAPPAEPLELILRPAREIQCTVVDALHKAVPDASVLVAASFEKFDEAKTDNEGRAAFRVPPDLPLQAVVAMKGGAGLDYWSFRQKDEPKSDPYKLAHDHAEPLTFVLNGARPVTIRVVDNQDEPLAGVKVYPWLLSKPNKGAQYDDLNLSGLDITQRTNREGVASFDFIPIDNTKRINFWARTEGYYSPERHMFDPASNASEVVAKLVPLVSVRGQVAFEDGRPAPDIDVMAVGAGHTMDGFRQSTRTDAAGNFAFEAYPDQYYQFFAGNRQWATDPLYKIVLAGQPVEDLQLRLNPATRVYGRVTSGRDKSPVKSLYLQLYRKDDGTYYKLPENQRLPNPKDDNTAVMPQIVWSGKTDDAGEFEFFVRPGKFYIFGPRNQDAVNFEVTDHEPHRVDIHSEQPETIPLTGRVVLRDDPDRKIAEAKVTFVSVDSFAGFLDAVSDSDGRFQVERAPHNMLIHALAPDRSLAGLIKIGTDDPSVIIPVSPTGIVRGRLVDEESGEAIPEREIDYGIHIDFGDGTSTTRFGGEVKTDEQGYFEAGGLVAGHATVFNAVVETDADGRARSWRQVATATPTTDEPVDLGIVKLEPPQRELTPEERVAKAFADPRSLEERLPGRLRDAKLGYQRVLVVAGDPASTIVKMFYELEQNPDSNSAILNYLLLPINTADADAVSLPSSDSLPSAGRAGEGGTARDSAMDFLTNHDILPPARDDMTLAVLDESGSPVAEAAGIELVRDARIDADLVARFLDAHKRELPDAEKLFADALAEAKRKDKRVLIQVSGPRCGWCFVLSRFLDDQKSLIDKEFVYVKLDPRMKNGDAVIKRVRPVQKGGIPWMAIYAPDGNPLSNSDGPNGNTGYPGEAESQVHFEKMLRTGTRHLTEDDIKSLLAALAANKI